MSGKENKEEYIPDQYETKPGEVADLGTVTFGQIETLTGPDGKKIGTIKKTHRARVVRGAKGNVTGLPAEGVPIPLRDLRPVLEETEFHELEKARDRQKARRKKRQNLENKPN